MTIGDAITQLIEVYNRLVEDKKIDTDPVAVALFITMREATKDAERRGCL